MGSQQARLEALSPKASEAAPGASLNLGHSGDRCHGPQGPLDQL